MKEAVLRGVIKPVQCNYGWICVSFESEDLWSCRWRSYFSIVCFVTTAALVTLVGMKISSRSYPDKSLMIPTLYLYGIFPRFRKLYSWRDAKDKMHLYTIADSRSLPYRMYECGLIRQTFAWQFTDI